MEAFRKKEKTPKDLGERRELLIEKHIQFIVHFTQKDDSFEHVATEHLKMSGVYWALTALHLLGAENQLNDEELLSWVSSCQKENGGFAASPRHDPHLLFTLSAIQILALMDRLDVLNVPKVVEYISSLQNENGSFRGDIYGEVDTRFSYCAISACTLLKQKDAIRFDKAVEFVLSCQNPDGGFGIVPGTESHSGQVFCCIGALSIAQAMDLLNRPDLTAWWLCERQTASGGLNGRPEKLQDVCYTWWCLSCLHILNKLRFYSKKIKRMVSGCIGSIKKL